MACKEYCPSNCTVPHANVQTLSSLPTLQLIPLLIGLSCAEGSLAVSARRLGYAWKQTGHLRGCAGMTQPRCDSRPEPPAGMGSNPLLNQPVTSQAPDSLCFQAARAAGGGLAALLRWQTNMYVL